MAKKTRISFRVYKDVPVPEGENPYLEQVGSYKTLEEARNKFDELNKRLDNRYIRIDKEIEEEWRKGSWSLESREIIKEN